MIKKIKIKKLGRFENFEFTGVNEFKRFNVFYGWNYSGKTTLSRAFRLYDTKLAPEHYENGFDFTIETESNVKISSTNPNDISKIQTKVFNSDYVENNLFFENTGATNILVLADNAKDTMSKIEQLDKEIITLHKSITNYENELKEHQDYLTKKRSNESAKIRTTLHCTFTASTFQTYEKKLQDTENINTFIIEDNTEVCNKRSIAIAEKNKNSIEPIELLTNNINLDELKAILNKTVNITNPLNRLSNNKDGEKWVREGLEIHKNSEICLYCGHSLSEDIIKELNEHFDKSYNELISRIEHFQNNLKIVSTFNNLPDTSKFYNQFEIKYLKDKEQLEFCRKQFNAAIKRIQELLEQKLKSITKSIPCDLNYDFNSLNTQIQYINNGIIKEHNNFNDNFDKQKEIALEELKKHYVAEVILGPDFIQANKVINDSITGITKAKKDIEEKEKEKEILEAQISESAAGAEKVNSILNRLFMGKSEIELTQKSAVEKDKYILKRNSELAYNLSEGEKTAIAFAHYLANLEAKELNDKLGEIVLYIDDPISSLDNNHIYAVYTELIRLRNESFTDSLGNKKLKYKQLFISTHNYHLFGLLTEKINQNIECYYVQRNKQCSVITNFPRKILQQKAEYSFLFAQIKNYIANSEEEDYIIGHFLRRFLEIFATYKNPTRCNNFKERIQQIVDLKQEYKENDALVQTIYKTINEESHTYITNEVINNGNLINTAQAVLDFVKMIDPEQYSFLEKNYEN